MRSKVGNCDIDFLNFCHRQVQNFKIWNLYEWNPNFGVIFWKFWKQSQKSTKCFKMSQKPWVIPLKFHKMSLISWNLVNYCKIMQFLVKFSKSLKDLRKILLKWLGKTVKYCLHFVNFHSCTEKWPKVCQLSSTNLMKVYHIPQRFSCGLYYKHITIVIDTASVVSKWRSKLKHHLRRNWRC